MPRAGPLRGPPNPTRAPRQEWELGPQRAPKNQPQTARVVLSNKTAADPRAHVVLLDTKNDDHRGMPLHPRAVAALANLQHRTGPVFRRPDKKPYEPMDGEGGQFKTAFRGACRRAGISDFHPHDCRHTWATWHYSANRDLRAHDAGRLEDGRDGAAICPHQRQQSCAGGNETRGKSGDCRSGKLSFSTETRPLRVSALALAKVGVEGF